MADLGPGQTDVVMRHMRQQKSDQYCRPGYHAKGNHSADPVHHLTLSRRLTIVQHRLYASSEYDEAGTCSSIARSSATIFGLRSQT